MKKYLFSLIGLLMSMSSFAQEAASKVKSFREDPVHHPSFPVFVVSLLGVAVVTLLVMVVANIGRILRIVKAGKAQAPNVKG